jgi:hypothetical protein
MNMTEKQKLFLKILKSGKYSKNWRDWDNLDKISEFICKLGYWQANYRELFGEEKLLGNLPAIDGAYLTAYAKLHTLKQTIDGLENLIKGK